MSSGAILHTGASLAEMALLYDWLESAVAGCNLPDKTLHAMHVALEEAAMNVAMHGLPPGTPGQLSIYFTLEADAATLRLEDEGTPFNQAEGKSPPQATRLQDATPGGNGLKLLRHYCKQMEYEFADGRNQLTLRFPLDAG